MHEKDGTQQKKNISAFFYTMFSTQYSSFILHRPTMVCTGVWSWCLSVGATKTAGRTTKERLGGKKTLLNAQFRYKHEQKSKLELLLSGWGWAQTRQTFLPPKLIKMKGICCRWVTSDHSITVQLQTSKKCLVRRCFSPSSSASNTCC